MAWVMGIGKKGKQQAKSLGYPTAMQIKAISLSWLYKRGENTHHWVFITVAYRRKLGQWSDL